MAQPTSPIFAHLTLATRDVQRAASFYTKAFGWQPIERPQNIERPAAWLSIAAGTELHLLEVSDFEISRYEAEFGRHVAFAYPQSGFAELKKRIVEHGGRLIDPQRDTPFERFFFRDLDGYVIEVGDLHVGTA